MKKNSKLMSVILALVLTLSIFSVFSLTASAGVFAPEIKLVSNKAAVQIGEVISVDVTVPKNSRFCNLNFDFIFDNTNLLIYFVIYFW